MNLHFNPKNMAIMNMAKNIQIWTKVHYKLNSDELICIFNFKINVAIL